MNETESTMSTLCRCCLSQSIYLNDLFEPTDDIDITKAFQDICGINIDTESSLSSKICDECLSSIKFCYNFRIETQQSDATLRNLLEGTIAVKDYIENEEIISSSQSDLVTVSEEDFQSDDELTTTDIVYQESVSDVDVNSIESKQCPYCKKEFAHLKNMRTHIQRHFIKGKYNCPHCPSRYHTKYDVQRHMTKAHSDGVVFKCDICDKEFPTKPEWSRHIKSHDDLKPFSCVECGKQFRFKHNAQQHILISHAKEKSYFCEICGKGFPHACKLNLHKKKECKPSIHISILKEDLIEEEEL
ncbi:zinc finger and BTB domain-containing protein 17-like [Episyrphus balteatus]|uniref:zinc finger and BTB domain-containing protein 17-like n=1 Tax=Episyrphus balteatus TaxID=286459 RepID=UPI0024857D81|nr:zinc finger and BTB domain-containing protein 17-like [Episyrphus balteatus]